MRSMPLLWQRHVPAALPLNTVPEGGDVTLTQAIGREDGDWLAAGPASSGTPSSACCGRPSALCSMPSDTWTTSCVLGVLPETDGSKRPSSRRKSWMQVGRGDLLKLLVCGSKLPSSPSRSMQADIVKTKGHRSSRRCSLEVGTSRGRSREGRGGDVAVVPAEFAAPSEHVRATVERSSQSGRIRRSWSESTSSRMRDLLPRRQSCHRTPTNPHAEVAAAASALERMKEEYERNLMGLEDMRSNATRQVALRSCSSCSDVAAPCPTDVPSPARILAPCTPSSTHSSPGAAQGDRPQGLISDTCRRDEEKVELLCLHSIDDEERRARLEQIAAEAAVSTFLPSVSPASRSVRSRSISSDSVISGSRRPWEFPTRLASKRPDEQNIVQARQLLADMFASTRSSPSSQSNPSRVMPCTESPTTKSQMSKGGCDVHWTAAMDTSEPNWQATARRSRKNRPVLSDEPKVEVMVTCPATSWFVRAETPAT